MKHIPILLALATMLVAATAHAQKNCPVVAKAYTGFRPVTATPTACLEGRLKLIRVALGRPISDLESQELANFAESYGRLVMAFNASGDDVQEAMREAGYAQAQLELAREELKQAIGSEARQEATQSRFAPITESIASIQVESQTQLLELHAEYQQSQAPETLDRMALLAHRIENMERLQVAAEQAVEPDHNPSELQEPFDIVRKEIDDEVRVTIEHARLMGELVLEASREMDNCLTYLKAESRIPYEQVARLRETRERIGQSLDELNRFRDSKQHLVDKVRQARPLAMDGQDTDDVLELVRQLLEERQARAVQD